MEEIQRVELKNMLHLLLHVILFSTLASLLNEVLEIRVLFLVSALKFRDCCLDLMTKCGSLCEQLHDK